MGGKLRAAMLLNTVTSGYTKNILGTYRAFPFLQDSPLRISESVNSANLYPLFLSILLVIHTRNADIL